MFPTVHGEKTFSLDWETGFIMKRPSAEQTPELKGQQGGLEEQLPLHYNNQDSHPKKNATEDGTHIVLKYRKRR
jgi:hypothetical protein